MYQNATVKVRADGKIAAAYSGYSKLYYHLHTSVSDWSMVSGFDPYTYTNDLGWTDNPTSSGYGNCLTTGSNEDYTSWSSKYNFSQSYQIEAAEQRSSGTSGAVTQRWDGSRTGNEEDVYTISLNTSSGKIWLCCKEENGSQIFPMQLFGFDKDTASPGSGGTTNAALSASGIGYKDMHYNADSGYDSGGYLAATISWPNTLSGLMVAKATSADAPASLAWSRKIQFGTPAYTYQEDLRGCSTPVVDSAGNIYVAYWNKIKSPDLMCYIICSWENDGTFRWARTLSMEGSSGYEWGGPGAANLMVTANDNLVFVGEGGMTTSASNHGAVLIARLPSDGSLTSASAIQPRGDATCNIFWSDNLTGSRAAIETAGGLGSATATADYIEASSVDATTNLATTVVSNTRVFGQAEVTG
jgi:hypothetical protein